jgi:hypothetical protein
VRRRPPDCHVRLGSHSGARIRAASSGGQPRSTRLSRSCRSTPPSAASWRARAGWKPACSSTWRRQSLTSGSTRRLGGWCRSGSMTRWRRWRASSYAGKTRLAGGAKGITRTYRTEASMDVNPPAAIVTSTGWATRPRAGRARLALRRNRGPAVQGYVAAGASDRPLPPSAPDDRSACCRPIHPVSPRQSRTPPLARPFRRRSLPRRAVTHAVTASSGGAPAQRTALCEDRVVRGRALQCPGRPPWPATSSRRLSWSS